MDEYVVFQRVRELILDLPGLYIERGDIDIESHLMYDLGLDSIDMVELSLEIERTFNIQITDVEMERLFRVSDIVKLVKKKNDNDTNSK